MKCITVHQPHATLLAVGAKKFETRGWAYLEGVMAIHAGKKIDRKLCETEPFKSILAEHGFTADNLPLGAVIATAYLGGCHKVVANYGTTAILEDGRVIDSPEYYFGDYEVDRFAWEYSDMRELDRPIPAKGQQGIWNWNEEGLR